MSLFDELKKRGIWRGYERHVVMLEPILVRMSERGMGISPERFAEVNTLLKTDLDYAYSTLQEMVPPEVKTPMPKDGYKREPKDTTGMIQLANGRWAKLKKWSPSNKGLIKYMNFKKHPIPKAIKTGKDTTNKLELKRLGAKTGDPLYKKVLGYRKAQTILTNHMVNWKPGPDNRVHSTFYCDPATGQLSSRRPNVQNAPKHDDPEFGAYAKAFRSMIVASPGHTLIEFDYKSFHVHTLAFEAEDPVMLRMGRLDIHSFVTAHFLKLGDAEKLMSLPDDELRDRLKWIKKNHKHDRDAKVKHALLGYNNGMGYVKLYKQYEEYFAGESEAKKVLKLLDVLFPKSKIYRDEICQKAHEQGYLLSRHGYIRWFWEVFRFKGYDRAGNIKWSHGDDHEAALCFYTQNDAHGELKDRMITLGERGLDERYHMINNIHDALIFDCPNSLVDECIATVQPIMQSPSKVLVNSLCPDGLWVEVAVQLGPSWDAMKEI